jgi:hypothetical protein
MAAGLVPTIIETVERAMESLRLREGLSSDDEALLALRRKVALQIGQLDLPEPSISVNDEPGMNMCQWPFRIAGPARLCRPMWPELP